MVDCANAMENRMTAEDIATGLAGRLAEKKAEDVRVYDVRGISPLADFYIVATGAAAPHLKALAETVRASAREYGDGRWRSSGEPDSGWIVVDGIDVVVHVFSPEARAYYALEKLWDKAPQVAF